MIQASRHGVFTTGTYSVIEAYTGNRGDWSPRANVECEVFHDLEGTDLGVSVPVLDVSATASDAGDKLYIKVVNSSEHPVAAAVDVQGLAGQLRGEASVQTVTASGLDAHNTFSEPDVVRLRDSSVRIAGPELLHEFPALSVTVIRLSTI